MQERFLAGLAGQLGRPAGMLGRVVARGQNRANGGNVTAAVEATGVRRGQSAADIGFGGGVGLPLLLARVRPGGHVHGVDLSETMLDRARRNLRSESLAGGLTLHLGSITALPLSGSLLDALITVNTIYFVTDLDLACTEMARVLRPSGRAVVGIGDPVAMARQPFTAHGFVLRPVDEVVATLAEAGLTAVGHQRVGDGDDAFHLLVAQKVRA